MTENNRPPLTTAPISGEYFVFRDPVHNLIEVDDEVEGRELRKILDTKEFQRLRFLKQNGVGYFVYPGLEGSRFQHSLGTYHVARRIVRHLMRFQPDERDGFPDHLRITDHDCVCFCFAALLHDIGHGPLSHVWEHLLEGQFNHEEASFEILNNDNTDIALCLKEIIINGRPIHADVISFLSRTHRLYYLYSLLDGNIDVDRLDFMARDTRAAGVTYGFHDLDWIIRTLRFAKLPSALSDDNYQWIIAIDGRKGLNTVAQFLDARNNMYELVYLHKTIRCMTAMIMKAFDRSKYLFKQGNDVYINKNVKRFLNKEAQNFEITKIDDGDVWSQLKIWSQSESDPILKEISNSILSRDLFKMIKLDEFKSTAFSQDIAQDFFKNAAKFRGITNEETDDASEYYYHFDHFGFDIIGKEYHPSDAKSSFRKTWIIQDQRFGHKFTTLREWYSSLNKGKREAEIKYSGLIVDKRLLASVVPVIKKIESIAESKVNLDSSSNQVFPSIDGYQIIAEIGGSGAHKRVFAAYKKPLFSDSKIIVALKIYKDDQVSDTFRDVESGNFIASVNHGAEKYISVAKKMRIDSNEYKIAIEESLWDYSLEDYIKRIGELKDIKLIIQMSKELFKALDVLHSSGLRHTDIKPDNCGIEVSFQDGFDRFSFKIGDLGCCSSTPESIPSQKSLLGTERTRAPELYIQEPKIGLSSDVWAMAVTIFAAMRRDYWFLPFDLKHHGEGIDPESEKIRTDAREMLDTDLAGTVERFRQRVHNEIPSLLGDVLKRALLDFDERPTARQLAEAFSKIERSLTEDELVACENVWRMSDEIIAAIHGMNDSKQLEEAARYQGLFDKFQRLIPRHNREKLYEYIT